MLVTWLYNTWTTSNCVQWPKYSNLSKIKYTTKLKISKTANYQATGFKIMLVLEEMQGQFNYHVCAQHVFKL